MVHDAVDRLGQCRGKLARVDLAGRELEHHALHRVAELALEEQRAVGKLGNHDHRTGMAHVFAHALAAIRQPDPIPEDLEQCTIEYPL